MQCRLPDLVIFTICLVAGLLLQELLTNRKVKFTHTRNSNQSTPLQKPGQYEVLIFRNRSGESPHLEWLDTLDWKMQARILARVARMKNG